MRKLLHKKANALQAIRDLTDEMSAMLSGIADIENYESILRLLERRKAKMDEIDVLDKQIAFLDAAGFFPANETEAAGIQAERGTIVALLEKIREADELNSVCIAQVRERLMEDLKEIKDGQRSAQAYSPPTEESYKLDTLR